MLHKKYKTVLEILRVTPELKQVLVELDLFTQSTFGKEILITSLFRDDSFIHGDGRGGDLRTVVPGTGKAYFTTSEIKLIRAWLIWRFGHRIQVVTKRHGTGPHIHVGINKKFMGKEFMDYDPLNK